MRVRRVNARIDQRLLQKVSVPNRHKKQRLPSRLTPQTRKLESLRGRAQKGRSATQGNTNGPVGMGSSVRFLIGVAVRIVARFSSLLLL